MQIQNIIPADAVVTRWNANIDVISDRSTQLFIENLEKIQKNSEEGYKHTETWLKDGKKTSLSLI